MKRQSWSVHSCVVSQTRSIRFSRIVLSNVRQSRPGTASGIGRLTLGTCPAARFVLLEPGHQVATPPYLLDCGGKQS